MEQNEAVQRVVGYVRERGGTPQVRRFEESVPTAAAAANLLGCDASAIVNSLVFAQDGDTPLLILSSGAYRVDTTQVAEWIGAGKVKRASYGFVVEHTGQEPGGVAPVGHPSPIRTLIDERLRDHDVLWAGGGDEFTMFSTSVDELVRLTGGAVTEVRPATADTP